METLLYAGVALTLAGIGLLLWCIARVLAARRAGLDDAALKERLRGIVALNLAALGLSGLGLMAVIVGLALG